MSHHFNHTVEFFCIDLHFLTLLVSRLRERLIPETRIDALVLVIENGVLQSVEIPYSKITVAGDQISVFLGCCVPIWFCEFIVVWSIETTGSTIGGPHASVHPTPHVAFADRARGSPHRRMTAGAWTEMERRVWFMTAVHAEDVFVGADFCNETQGIIARTLNEFNIVPETLHVSI